MNHSCPPEDRLFAFHRGCLREADLDAIADHLDTCPRCEATVQGFDTSGGPSADPLLDILRNQLTHHPAGPPAAPDALDPAHWPTVPGYEIVSAIGRGGMGEVYKARQVRLNRYVALKRLRCSDDREIARSRIEAVALARLHHPGVVQIYEFLEHDGGFYLALELIEGGSLADRVAGRPQPPAGTAELIEAVARAVHHAHTSGIIHRDLKPANILLQKDFETDDGRRTNGASNARAGNSSASSPPSSLRLQNESKLRAGNPSSASPSSVLFFPPSTAPGPPSFILQPSSFRPKVTDFGIAKHLTAGAGETRAGDVIGTPCYMAPEQAAGEGPVGPGADVYSLGVVLYEMLTGRVPLQGPTTLDTLLLVRSTDPVSPRRLQPGIPRDLEVICLKSLEKDPARRYPSAAALADDLRRFLAGQPIQARPTPPWERAWKAARRYPLVAGLSAALVLVAALGLGLVLWQWQRATALAVQEASTRREAEESERRTRRLSAGIALDRGTALSEIGEADRGLVWLARALELAVEVNDPDLERAARCNLAGWHAYRSRKIAEFRHTDWVWAIAMSPDGRTVLTGSKDGTARLWDAATGQPKTDPLSHGEPVWAVAFSPDGSKFVTGSGDDKGAGTVRVWDTETARLAYPPLPHPDDVSAIRFAPDGQTFLTVCPAEARAWRTADGRPVGEPMRHPRPNKHDKRVQPALTATIHPDGTVVATGGEDGTVRFWDAATGQPKGTPLRTTGPVLAVAFSPDGRTLLTGCFDGGAQMWDLATGRHRGPPLIHPGQVNAVAFSHDGQFAATGGAVEDINPETGDREIRGGEACLWQVQTGRRVGLPLVHQNAVWAVAFSPDDRLLLTGSRDSGARFFLVANGAQMGQTLGHEGTVTAVAFSPDGSTALTSSAGGHHSAAARLWAVPPGLGRGKPILQPVAVHGTIFAPDGRSLLTWGSGTARVVDLTGRELGPVRVHPELVTAAAFSPDGRSFATGTYNGLFQLWETTAERARFVVPFRGAVYSVAFTPDGRSVIVSYGEGNVSFRDAETGQEQGSVLRYPGVTWSVTVSPDGGSFLTACDGAVQLNDLRTRQTVRTWTGLGNCTNATFYPDGKHALLVVGGFAHDWTLDREEEPTLPRFHPEGGIERVAISPDGQMVMISSAPAWEARVWDVAAGKPLGPPLARGGARPVAFSPDGRLMAAGDADGRATIWDTPTPIPGDPHDLRAWVEAMTGLGLDSQGVIRTLNPDRNRPAK